MMKKILNYFSKKESSIKPNTIIVLKLSTEEEIVGIYTHQDSGNIYLNNPLKLIDRVDPSNGNHVLVLIRYNTFSDETSISFNNKFIISTYLPNNQYFEWYLSSLRYIKEIRDNMANENLRNMALSIHSSVDMYCKTREIDQKRIEKKLNVSSFVDGGTTLN